MFRSLTTLLIACALTLASCTKKVDENDTSINVAVQANVKGLDPIFSSDTYSNTVVAQIYETLYSYHYLKRPLTLIPALAAALPEVSSDGLTHTIKIKSGVLYHDNAAFPEGKGRELVAEDFLYAWKRLADPTNQSDGFWIFDGKIQGLNEWREKVQKGEADYTTAISGLQAPDKNTIVIKLTQPYYQLHYVLAMPYSSPVPKEAVDKYGKEFLNNPVGTGPFKFESWVRNSKITLVKNPTWRGETYPTEGEASDQEAGFLNDAGKALPFAEKIVFNEIIEDQPRWLNFMKGNLDVTGIPKDNFDGAVQDNAVTKELADKGVRLIITREPDVTYTAFNMLDPILGKNENLRKAIALATDTDSNIKKFYNGRAIRAHSPIPPDVDAYDPNFKNPYAEYDIAKAKEFLAKAGFPEGKGLPPLEFSTTNSSTARQMAESFQQNMEKIGIKINIVTNSWPQFNSKIKEKKAQIWGIAWLADYPDAENFLQLLYGENVSPGPNGSNYQNKQFDDLYKKASRLPPGEARTKVYQEMRDLVVKDTPWVTGVHRLGYYVHHGWMKNYKPHAVVNDFFKYIRVDGKERAKGKAKL